jgi:hypothetical protein
MLRKVRIEEAWDTELLPMELFDRFEFEDINARTIAAGGEQWMPKARALAAMFGTDEEEVLAVPAEELSLEDLEDDEGAEEGLEDLEDAEPTPADLTKTEEKTPDPQDKEMPP